jgi:hypothetical protein
MSIRLFNGPTCQLLNWYVDLKDGTTTQTAADPPGIVNTYGPNSTHHTHHSHHERRRKRQRLKMRVLKPIKLMSFNLPAVARLLHAVAMLEARRDQLVIAWETWAELKNQEDRDDDRRNKRYSESRVLQNDPFAKTKRSEGPSDDEDYEQAAGNKFAGAFTVETGNMDDALWRAKNLTDQSMQIFTSKIPLGGREAWNYLVYKRDQGHQHLNAMAAVYRKAANANRRERTDFDALARTAETVKLSMGAILDVVGALVPETDWKAGVGIEAGYQILTSETMVRVLSTASGEDVEPDMVGISGKSKGIKKELKDLGVEGAGIAGKEISEALKHRIEHAIEKLEKIIGEEATEALLRKNLLDEQAKWISQNLEDKGLKVAQELEAVLKDVVAIRNQQSAKALKNLGRGRLGRIGLVRVLAAARWYYIGHQVREKLEKIYSVWDQPIEDEEHAATAINSRDLVSDTRWLLDQLKKGDVFGDESEGEEKTAEGDKESDNEE